MMKSFEMVENEWRSMSMDLNDCIATHLCEIERFWDDHIEEVELCMERESNVGNSERPETGGHAVENGFDLSPFITIEQYLDNFIELVPHMDAAYRMEIAEKDIPNLLKIALFPVLEEAMSNIRHHSAASRVRVTIQRKGAYLVLTVADDGPGFDPESRFAKGDSAIGKGLSRIREWVELFDGVFILKSDETSGTSLIISLPI